MKGGDYVGIALVGLEISWIRGYILAASFGEKK